MKIIRRVSTDGTLRPVSVNLLGQIPPEALFHVAHRLRHPEAIYNLSLGRLAAAFAKTIEAYFSVTERANENSATFEAADLLRQREDLLRKLQEHLDDCWSVLKALVDPLSATRSPLFTEKYVVENKLPGARSFRDAIAGFKSSLRIANKLRHQQGRLRGVAMWVPGRPTLGYFLEEPDAQGVIGPSSDIHPDRGAFSFARDLTWRLSDVYMCSEKLVSAVRRALGARGVRVEPKVTAEDKEWEKLLSLVSKIPVAFFPKELRKPSVSFSLGERAKVLTIKSPEHVHLIIPQPVKMTCSTEGDGHSRVFAVPFP